MLQQLVYIFSTHVPFLVFYVNWEHNMFLRPFKFYPFLYLYISIYSIPFYVFINQLIISVFISSLLAVYFYYIPYPSVYISLVSMSIQFHLFVFIIFLVLYSLSFCLYSVSFHYSFIHSTQLY